MPSAIHFFIARIYGCGIADCIAFTGLANRLIANKIALVVRDAFSFECRHTPTKSSIYPSTQPCLGMFNFTSTGRACPNGMESGCRIGFGIEFGGGCDA